MMLVQKPPQIPSNPPYSHRRHPSAPPATVVVQATRTPGLLSLTKPPRSSPNRQQQLHIIQYQHSRQTRTPKSKPPPQHKDTPPVDFSEKNTTPSSLSTDKNPRGRSQAKLGKDLTSRRSTSNPSSRGLPRRNNNRQPSPPVQITSQAEGLTQSPASNSQSFSRRNRNPDSNLFDPFLINASSDTDSGSDNAQPPPPPKPMSLRSTPKLLSLPSGKLARRRRQPIPQVFTIPTTPTPPSKAVPVVRNNVNHHGPNISHSDPLSSHMPTRPADKRSTAISVKWDAFPVCDDTGDDLTPPSTPVLEQAVTLASKLDNGPRTAPMSSSRYSFSGFMTPYSSPSPASRTRRHQRTPSEGVFTLDDDAASPHSPEELQALIGLFSKGSPARISKEKAGYFASSMFQNSPNPEELPPPSFGALA